MNPSASSGQAIETLESVSARTPERSNVGPLIRIRPSRGWVSLKLRDLWAYRELLYFLVWRDVKVRYKQTVLGVSWVVLQPILFR